MRDIEKFFNEKKISTRLKSYVIQYVEVIFRIDSEEILEFDNP